MSTAFLFMDECYNEATELSSLTGLVVPLSDYQRLRSAFYGILEWAIRPKPNTLGQPPALHGSDFLRGEPDDRKLSTLDALVELVVENDLRVWRIGYYVTPPLKAAFQTDSRLLGLCWTSMQFMLAPLLSGTQLVPIMDRVPDSQVRDFSGSIRSLDVMRAWGIDPSIENSSNFIGEVFYSASEYAAFPQVADVVSYLRHICDLDNDGRELTGFKELLLERGRRLQSAIAEEHLIALNYDGVVQGPAHRARRGSGAGPITAIASIQP